jgi:hypothetical protein
MSAIEEGDRQPGADKELERLREFLVDMQRKGLVIKKEYDLPSLDTIGKTAYGPDRQGGSGLHGRRGELSHPDV